MERSDSNNNVQQKEAGFLLSVIIPCYNVQKYIRRCLDSLLQQTIGFSNIQLILVDDASTDHTLGILQEYESQHPDNILLIPLEENAGQGVARNIALEYAQADYVGFVDADDWAEPDMYEIMCRAAGLYQCEVVRCDCDRCHAWKAPELESREEISVTVYILDDPEEKEQYIYEHREDVQCMNKLFARNFLLEHEICFAEGIKYEDHLFGMLVLLYGSKIASISQMLYHWYQNTQSTCMGGKFVLDRIPAQQILYEECRKRGFLEKYRELLEFNLYEKMMIETIYYLRRQGVEIEPVLKQIMQIMGEMEIDIRRNRYYLQVADGENM